MQPCREVASVLIHFAVPPNAAIHVVTKIAAAQTSALVVMITRATKSYLRYLF